MEKEKIIAWLKIILFAVVLISIGLWGVNQFLDYKFHAQLLLGPCQLCANNNPQLSAGIQWCTNVYGGIPKEINIIKGNLSGVNFTR